MTFERGHNFGMATYYFGCLVIPVAMVLWKLLGIVKIAKKLEKANESAKVKRE